MKVSLYNNTLNLGFLLALFLRRKGHDVRVFVNRTVAEQDKPEWECVDPCEMASVPLVRVDVDVKRMLIGGKMERRFRRMIAEADVVQTFGEGVIWSAGCGTPDTVLSIGDDLDDLPFRRHSLRIRLYAAVLRRAQRRCRSVCYTMPPQQESCRRLGLSRAKFLPYAVPIDINRFQPCSREERIRIRARFGIPEREFVVFQPSRQQWTCPVEGTGSNHKANDRFLHAYARFVRGAGRDSRLLAVTKGADVRASQQLVENLGIQDRIQWIPQQNKAELCGYFSVSDVVADQFTYGFYGISTLEAMAVGCPVLIHMDMKSLERFGLEPPPVMSVHSEDEIYNALCRLAEKRSAREELGGRAREWIVQHHSWKPVVERYIGLYEDLTGQKQLSTGENQA